jgi:hypothetical protein
MAGLFLVYKQAMVSLTCSGSRVYGKQLKVGFMALSQTRALSKQEKWFENQSTAKHKMCFDFSLQGPNMFLACL